MSNQSIADQVEIWYGELKPLHALEIALLQHELGEMSKENILSLIGSNADPEPQLFAGLAIAFMSGDASRPSDSLIKKLKMNHHIVLYGMLQYILMVGVNLGKEDLIE